MPTHSKQGQHPRAGDRHSRGGTASGRGGRDRQREGGSHGGDDSGDVNAEHGRHLAKDRRAEGSRGRFSWKSKLRSVSRLSLGGDGDGSGGDDDSDDDDDEHVIRGSNLQQQGRLSVDDHRRFSWEANVHSQPRSYVDEQGNTVYEMNFSRRD